MLNGKLRAGALASLLFLLAAGGWLSTHWDSLAFNPPQKPPSPERIDSQESNYTNRLIHEKSPYLLQHAHNPVDWYPWGEEAFEKARRERKPVFLSVGYSTCHWCHVMERESFSDPEIAAIMNKSFVSIKVDREERPDIDGIYMSFVQATTGGGGWPMTVFLTPELKPFFGGTYFPREDGHGRPALRTVLQRIAQIWQRDPQAVVKSADEVMRGLQGFVNASAGSGDVAREAVLHKAYEQIAGGYDATYGGFGSAPKFPRPVVLNFLFRYYARTGKKEALEMNLHTLRAMAQGGIHDHLGGGFHRYSTDERWHVPHFEKMLYDQAQLASSYLDAYQITHDPFFADVARDILEYVLRDMRDPAGGFYSAEDADSPLAAGKPERAEGAFYVWPAAELQKILGVDSAAIFGFYYGVEPAGNVPSPQDIQGELHGRNILFLRHSMAETAKHFNRPAKETEAVLAKARQTLFLARSQRPRPPRDDKVLTAWNGQMISALARAAQVLDDPRYLQAAEASAGFIRSKLFDEKAGLLKRRYRAGSAEISGFLEDYAFLTQGLLDLYEASFNTRWLSWAARLQTRQDELFWDKERGGYFSTTAADPSLLMRMKEDYDGAQPSPNSVSAMNLLRLAQLTDQPEWQKKAQGTFAAIGGRLEKNPEALPQLVTAIDFSLSKPKQIVIAGGLEAADTKALLRLVHQRYIPNKVLLLADGGAGQKQLARWLPFIEGMAPRHGRATAFICENYVCKLPTSDPKVVARLLGQPE